jgi:hypothetical protein
MAERKTHVRHQTSVITVTDTDLGVTLSVTQLGDPIVMAGAGFVPGVTYGVNWIWPDDVGQYGQVVTADEAGRISKASWADWYGTYRVDVVDVNTQEVLASGSITLEEPSSVIGSSS